MVEQLTLFGERDPVSLVCEMFRQRYEWVSKHYNDRYISFERFVLNSFSSYQGGTSTKELQDAGYAHYGCSPKGKVKILRALGIKDDKKDALKEAAE